MKRVGKCTNKVEKKGATRGEVSKEKGTNAAKAPGGKKEQGEKGGDKLRRGKGPESGGGGTKGENKAEHQKEGGAKGEWVKGKGTG